MILHDTVTYHVQSDIDIQQSCNIHLQNKRLGEPESVPIAGYVLNYITTITWKRQDWFRKQQCPPV